MRSYLPNKSYFTGPAGLLRTKERRRYSRLLWAILTRGNTEPMELFMIAALFVNGATLIVSGENPYLHRAPLWGIAYLFVALAGLGGLLTRSKPARLWFGFGVFYLRIWVATLAGAHNLGDLQWCNSAIGALAGSWIFLRFFCAMEVARARRRRECHECETRRRTAQQLMEWSEAQATGA